jgi:ADP-heptose:LPS heptosyltransferase
MRIEPVSRLLQLLSGLLIRHGIAKDHRPPRPDDISSILVVALDGVGDMVITTPIFRELRLRFPDARIEVIADRRNVDLVRHNPHLDRVHANNRRKHFGKNRALLRTMRELRYDVIIDLSARLSMSRLRFLLSLNADTMIGIRKDRKVEHRLGLRTDQLRVYSHVFGADQGEHTRERILDVMGYFGHQPSSKDYELHYGEAGRAKVEAFRAQIGAGPVIGIAYGGTRRANTFGPVQLREMVARILTSSDATVVLLYGPRQRAQADRIVSDVGNPRFWLSPEADLLELAAVIDLCTVIVTPSTGAMHIGCALGKGIVSVQPDQHIYHVFGPISSGGCRIVHSESDEDIADFDIDEAVRAAVDLMNGAG